MNLSVASEGTQCEKRNWIRIRERGGPVKVGELYKDEAGAVRHKGHNDRGGLNSQLTEALDKKSCTDK